MQLAQVSVVIVVLPQCMASSVSSAIDIFQVANQVYAHQEQVDDNSIRFSLRLLSEDGAPVRTAFGQVIEVDQAVVDIDFVPDVVIVSGAFTANVASAKIQPYLDKIRPVINWVKAQHQRGATIASACTGAFILAEADIFSSGQEATTHWMMANKFRQRYPHISYNDEIVVLEYPRLFCAAATTAFIDLCIRLVQHFSSKSVALMTAKLMLADPYRELQKPFHYLHLGKAHQDHQIIKAQQWLEQHYAKKIRIDDLADYLAMGERTFKRRFKQATGITPLLYLQQLRVESAKHQLEVSTLSSQEIINRVGYEDLSSFSRLFKKHTGVSVEGYKRQFSRHTQS